MRNRLRTVMFGIGLMILLAQPAFAEELGQANITPRTKMAEIRSNPSIVGAGIYTYSLDQDRVLDRMYWDAQPLSCLSNHWTAQDAADGLNYLIRTYNAGQRVTFPLYTAEEIAQDTSRDGVELYYLPAEGAQANQKYALVIGGNAIVVSAEIREGISTAWNLHEMGYPVFVLRYRTFLDLGNNAPLQDLARAVQLVTSLDEELSIHTQGYALVGYSSGGQLVGVFANKERGYGYYGAAKPGALLLAYPVVNFSEVKIAYQALMDTGNYGWHYYCSSVADLVTDDYPPVFFWYGKDDKVLPWMINQVQGPALQAALEAQKVPYVVKVFGSGPQFIGVGDNTDAEGWLTEAVAFWEQQTAA